MLYDFNFGAVFYIVPIDSSNDKHEYYNLTSNIVDLQQFVGRIKVSGGGDTP